MRIFFYFFLIFIFLNNKATFALDLFDTHFNEIEFISKNIDETKNDKIQNLKIKLIKNIFKKILTDKDYKKIKRDIDVHFTNTLIKNLIIENESIINDRYSAKIKINFDKNLVLKYLRKNKIPYVYYLPNEFFTIILDDNRMKKNLLTSQNIYYNFLLNNEKKNFDFYKIPNLDINDRYLLNYNNVITQNKEAFKKISDKYFQKNLLLIHSIFDGKIYNINSYIFLNNEFLLINKLLIKEINFEEFFINTKFHILYVWKNNNNIQNRKLNDINCVVNYLNLFELKEINSLFSEISPIKSFNLKNIVLYNNIYEIKYYGNYNILKEIFNLKGINIEIINNKCEIRLI